MLTRKSRLLLALTAATPLLFAACTDNGIFNPMSDAAGTYQLAVYAGKRMPATYHILAGDSDFPQYPNGATFVVTSGTLVLNSNGTFVETNNFFATPTGQASETPPPFVSSGTWTLNGTSFTFSDLTLSRQVSGTLDANISNNLTIDYQESDGNGVIQSYEYIR
jgi:hypothetical protein